MIESILSLAIPLAFTIGIVVLCECACIVLRKPK